MVGDSGKQTTDLLRENKKEEKKGGRLCAASACDLGNAWVGEKRNWGVFNKRRDDSQSREPILPAAT